MLELAVPEDELIDFKRRAFRPVGMQEAIENIELGGAAFFTTIFSFFTSVTGKALLTQAQVIGHFTLQILIMPSGGVIEVTEMGVTIADFATAKNKNLNKTINLVNKVTKSAIAIGATCLSVKSMVDAASISLGVLVPYCFVVSMSVNVVFGLSLSIYHAVRMTKAPIGSALREAHRQALIKAVTGMVVNLVLIVVVTSLFILGVSSGVGLAFFSGIGIAAVAGTTINARIKKYHHQKALKAEADPNYKPVEKKKLLSRSTVFHNTDDVSNGTRAEGDPNDRLYVRDLATVLNSAKEQGQDTLRIVFIKIIDAKIDDLNKQIARAQQDKFSIFKVNETPKRTIKIKGLEALKNKIGNSFSREEIDEIAKNHPGIFQSFMKDKSDVELIFDTAKEYFARKQEFAVFEA